MQEGGYHRRSIRISGFDYSQPGAYFITICTWRNQHLFGEIFNGQVIFNPIGRIVKQEWVRTEKVRFNIELGNFVIMPDHLHGIIVIKETDYFGVGASQRLAPTPAQAALNRNGTMPGSIGAIIGQFKSIVTKRVKRELSYQGDQIWQRNYYEHIILNYKE